MRLSYSTCRKLVNGLRNINVGQRLKYEDFSLLPVPAQASSLANGLRIFMFGHKASSMIR